MTVATKAWATFALLFGMGFAILLRRAEARGTPFASFYLRRLVALGAIGAAAQVFFGAGILLDYALWGLPLLIVRKWSTRSLLVLAVLAASAGPLYDVGRNAIEAATLAREAATVAAHQRTEEATTERAALHTTEAEGGYGQLFRARLNDMADAYLNPQVLIPGASFALFLLGFLAMRYGVIEQPRRNVRPIATAMMLGTRVLGELLVAPAAGADTFRDFRHCGAREGRAWDRQRPVAGIHVCWSARVASCVLSGVGAASPSLRRSG